MTTDSTRKRKPYAKPAVLSREKCLLFDSCGNLEELVNGRSAGGLCAAHRRRKRKQQSLEQPLNLSRSRRMSKFQVLCEAALAFSEADGEDAYARAVDRLRKAAMRWAIAVLVSRPKEARAR